MFVHGYNVDMGRHPKSVDPFSLSAIAERLRISREALELTQEDMALRVGIRNTTWSNYETSTRRISISVANRLEIATGLALAWVYRGDFESLKPEIAAKIAFQMRVEARKSRQ